MEFPRSTKKPRGSNLNNGEVQCLLQYQEGQIEKTEQFKKFIPIVALETLIRDSSPLLHPTMSNRHRCPWKKIIYHRREVDWRSERSAGVVEMGVELGAREEVHHGGAGRRLPPKNRAGTGTFLYSNVSMCFWVYEHFTPRCFFTFCDFSRICNA